MEAYFDNLIVTRVSDSVRSVVVKVMIEDYGNLFAKYRRGMKVERYACQVAADIAKILKVRDREILSTFGSMESNNMTLIGMAMTNQRAGKHIINTRIKHTSVHNLLAFLKQQGFEVTYLSVDHRDHVSLGELEWSVRPDTIPASIMCVSNEMGVIEPVDEIAALIRGKNPNTPFHVNTTQAYGRLVIRPAKQGIDLPNVSVHKIHNPRGVGFLYIAPGVKVCPLLYGGGQQRNVRSGMENVSGIAGIGTAAKEIYTDYQVRMDYITGLKGYIVHRMKQLKGVTVNSSKGGGSALQIVSTSPEEVRSGVLLHALEDGGIYVSSGFVYSSNHPATSRTLKAIGVKKELLDSALRPDFGMFNAIKKVDYYIGILKKILPALRRYRQKEV